MKKTVLVLNMGMKSIRSIIFDSGGNKLAGASLPIVTSLSGDSVTQEPSEWIEKAEACIAEVLRQTGNIHIDFFTVTASASCLVCIDETGTALIPCMMVSDRRAKDESSAISQSEAFASVLHATKLAMDASLLLPKALWVKNKRPDVWDKVYKLLAPNDFLSGYFTGGIYATDYINAKKWHYDTKAQAYPEKLLATLGIPGSLLPTCIAPGSAIGSIDGGIAERLGLNKDILVVASTYDAICSFVGSGVHDEGESADVSGTVTVFRTVTHKDTGSLDPKLQGIDFNELGIHIVGGSNNLGGGLIEWVKQCYYQNEPLPYELMEKEAGETSVGAGGVIFLPYLLGERFPIWDSSARGVFFGLERAHTRKEMTRAVFESAGFIDVDMISAIESCGIAVKSIRCSGGLARIHLVSQIKADTTGKEIHVLSEFETTAAGAAMLCFIGQKVYGSLQEASDVFVTIRMIIKPDRKNHEKYRKVYALFKDTYKTVRPLFPERAKLLGSLYGATNTRIENL